MVVAAAALTMVGCGGSGNTAARSATGAPVVWVGSDATDAFMIQLTRQGSALSGTFDDTGLANVEATTTTPLHAGFTGVLDGTAMTLDFGLGSRISGTLTTDTMTLQWPQTDGSLAALTLKPGTVEGYNHQAAAIRGTAGANTQASIAADALQRTQAQIESAAAAVAQDMSRLRSATQAPDFSTFDSDMKNASNDLAQAKADAAQAASESDRNSACFDANSASYDANSVQYDSHSIDYDTNEIGRNADAVTSAVNTTSSDLAAYQQSAAALPIYSSPNAPDPAAIKSLVDNATKTAAGWKAKAAQYQSQVAQLVNQANAVAAQAQKQYC